MVTKGLFRRFCRLVGRDDLSIRPDLATDYDRFQHKDEIDCLVADWVKERTADEAVHRLRDARLPCGVVNDVDEVARDPQVIHDKALADIDYGGWGMLETRRHSYRSFRDPGAREQTAAPPGRA